MVILFSCFRLVLVVVVALELGNILWPPDEEKYYFVARCKKCILIPQLKCGY